MKYIEEWRCALGPKLWRLKVATLEERKDPQQNNCIVMLRKQCTEPADHNKKTSKNCKTERENTRPVNNSSKELHLHIT